MSMPDNKYLVYDNYIGGLIEKDLEKIVMENIYYQIIQYIIKKNIKLHLIM